VEGPLDRLAFSVLQAEVHHQIEVLVERLRERGWFMSTAALAQEGAAVVDRHNIVDEVFQDDRFSFQAAPPSTLADFQIFVTSSESLNLLE
jgi:hypothetical protein